ncbi:hypothetical protein ACQPWY_30295 [Pseudonocardia xinjiangensis]|uniref:hypothetical protein n=1 Tax=Pseudonocardia xinjiangensis TaxID=75289 RepID=UPI003D94781B
MLKSLWLWVGLAALGILAGALAVSRQRLRTLRAWAVTTGVIALLLAFSLVLIRGPLLSGVQPANVEVANAVYDGITASLRSWTLWLVLIMAGITAATLLWGRIGSSRPSGGPGTPPAHEAQRTERLPSRLPPTGARRSGRSRRPGRSGLRTRPGRSSPG